MANMLGLEIQSSIIIFVLSEYLMGSDHIRGDFKVLQIQN